MEIPKATDGNEDDMHSAFLSLTALQGHVTRATNNLSQTLGMEGPTKESITHAVDKLEKQLDKYTEQQMETVQLCADEKQVAVLEARVNHTISLSEELLRKAIRIKSNISEITPVINTTGGPKKVTFRPLDHDNVKLWIRQLEDVFDTMGINGQLNRFTTLTTLLNDSEAMVIQDITMSDPRPENVFDQAKHLLTVRYDRPVHECLTRAIAMGGFDTDESPSQWLARFRQTRGKCSIDDLDRWALMRRMPSSLHPTLDALQPPPTLEEFVKHADRLIQTVTRSDVPVNVVSVPQASGSLSPENDIQAIYPKSRIRVKAKKRQHSTKKCVCWFHDRFGKDSRTCEGEWCLGYKDGITIHQNRRSGNDQGEQQ